MARSLGSYFLVHSFVFHMGTLAHFRLKFSLHDHNEVAFMLKTLVCMTCFHINWAIILIHNLALLGGIP